MRHTCRQRWPSCVWKTQKLYDFHWFGIGRSCGAIVMQHMFASCYESLSVYSKESLGSHTHNAFISKQRGCVVIEGEIVLLSRVGFHSELE